MAQLTEKQKYLLNRIPKLYDIKDEDADEPVEVIRARKVVASFEEKQSNIRQKRKAKYAKALSSAREAIYFKTPEKALDIIKAIEADFGIES